MNNALMYLGGLLIVVLAALFAVPAYVDWNGYRGVFEEEASRVLGRDVRVGGGVNLRILPTPYVRFEKVRLSDTTGQTGEPFIRAENFTMRLAIAPLLRGELEANEIELNKPVLTLALDGQGGGNWSSMAVKSGSLPFVPQNVSLRSVKISDGAIGVYGPSAALVSRVEAINGELSADSLKGPFKFKGLATWSSQTHEVKFATTAPSEDGSLLVRATSRTEGSANTFSFDGKLEDLSGKPKLAGDLSAKLVVPGVTEAAKDSEASKDKESSGTKKTDEPLVMDFKSQVKADASGAEYNDIALSLDNAAEPQLLSGTAKSSWTDPGRFDISLVSKSIDLDRLSGAGQSSATFDNIKSFAFGLMKSVAGEGAAGARLDIEQVKIGGELTGGLRLDAERGTGVLKIKSMQIGVPGGALMHLAGDVKDEADSTGFSGSGFVHGASLARLLAWAEKSGASTDVKSDGPFSFGGKVAFNGAGFDLTDAFGEIAGKPFSGALSVGSGEKRKLSVILEAASLNTSELFPALASSLERELQGAFGLKDKGASLEQKSPTSGEAARDVMVRVIANELKHGANTFRNVDATLGFEAENIRIPFANFTTGRGLSVLLEGLVTGASSQPRGQIAYEVTGASADSLKDFVSVFGLSHLIPEDRLAALGSGKAAGVIRLGERAKGTADLTIDGVAGESRISGSAEFDQGLSLWRTAPSRAQITAKGANLRAFLGMFGGDQVKATSMTSTGDLKIAITGPIAKGAATVAEIQADGSQLSFSGQTQWPDNGDMRVDGGITVKASELSQVLALSGVETPGSLSGVTVDGRIAVKRDQGGVWSLSSDKIALNSSLLSGSANFSRDSSGKPKLTADVATTQLSVASLLAGVTDRPSAPVVAQVPTDDAPAEATTPKQVIWPDAAFTLDKLGELEGDVRVAFGSLSLGEQLAVRNGALKISIAPGKVSLPEIKGTAVGGDFEGSLDLSKIQGGIGASARLKLDRIDLAQLSSSAKGGATLELSAAGRGLSPASLIGSLNGQGAVSFVDATMRGPSTRTGADLVDAVVQNEVKNSADDIAGAMQGLLQSASVNVGSRAVPITISNGIAKSETQTFESGQDKLIALAQANLSTLALTNSWMISSMMPPLPQLEEAVEGWTPPVEKGPLPPIAVAYTGQLDRLGDLEPKIDAAELQRELTVRLMERNVAQLERLRKLDEQRARRELERRRAIEAEKAAAAAAAAAARAAAREAAQAPPPPIVPEPVAPDANVNGAPQNAGNQSGTQATEQSAQPRPWAANPQPIEQPGQTTAPAQAPAAANGGLGNGAAATVQTEQAPVSEPQRGDTASQNQPAQAGVDPAAAAPIEKPQAPRATNPKPRATQKRTTTADDISRALGGIP